MHFREFMNFHNSPLAECAVESFHVRIFYASSSETELKTFHYLLWQRNSDVELKTLSSPRVQPNTDWTIRPINSVELLFQSYLARRLTKRKTIEKQAIQSVRLANTKATNVTARHMLRFFLGLLFWRMTHIWKFVSDPMASVANNVTVTREEEVEQSSVVFHATHETFDAQNVNNWTATDRPRSKCFISGLVRAHFRSDYNAICSFVSSIRPPTRASYRDVVVCLVGEATWLWKFRFSEIYDKPKPKKKT